jgi:hypothetical protein
MMPDITEYYRNDDNEPVRHGYKRRHEPGPQIIAQCYTCGEYLTTGSEVLVDNLQDFCSKECVDDYNKTMEGENE